MSALVYHTGLLACDRTIDEELNDRANKLLRHAEEGQCQLTHRKIADGAYEYRCHFLQYSPIAEANGPAAVF